MSLNDYRDEAGDDIGYLRPQVLAMLGLNQDQITAAILAPLSVEAHESRIYLVNVEARDTDTARTICAVLKRYDDSAGAERVSNDAHVLQMIHDARVKVPKPLGHSPEGRLMLMEYAGDTTLADLLKGGVGVPPSTWTAVMKEISALHSVLGDNWSDDSSLPQWVFSYDQRRDWALQGLQQWREWLGPEHELSTLTDANAAIAVMAQRLSRPDRNQHIVWGDCNPKNILVSGNDVSFLDLQLKRSSIMLDLVLLFSFADAPETYLPRTTSHRMLDEYWSVSEGRFETLGSQANFLAWYDDELLWRILVYGGMLLDKKEARLSRWSAVCQRMLPNLLELMRERVSETSRRP